MCGSLLSKLKAAGVSSVSAGILRFQGTRSRRRCSSGPSAPRLRADRGRGAMMAKVRTLIAEFGFEARESFFDWKPAGGMDEFLPTATEALSHKLKSPHGW